MQLRRLLNQGISDPETAALNKKLGPKDTSALCEISGRK